MGKKSKNKKQRKQASELVAVHMESAEQGPEHTNAETPESECQKQGESWAFEKSSDIDDHSRREVMDHQKCKETLIHDAAEPNSFESIKPPLSDGVLKYLKSKRFHSMTPVQSATIPLFLTNKDVAVQAVTGSGKTLAFVIPIVEMLMRRTTLLRKSQIGAIILSPTRELANQTFQVALEICNHVSLPPPLLLVGGKGPVTDDLRVFATEGNDIVVATPGRLEDVLTRYDSFDVSELDCLVLDEADVLLDMGFYQTLNTILSRLPRMRRTGLFSATGTSHKSSSVTSRGIKELMSRAGMRNPVWVNVAIASAKDDEQPETEELTEQATPSSLSNYYLISPLDEKLSRFVAFLRSHKDETIIVFFLTCACVEFFGCALQQLLGDELKIELLHGKLVQKRREKTMERFRESGGILFCTDVASRGLDVCSVQWVMQFDAPKDPASYIHRVGRSARAGRSGSSLLFLSPKEESYVDFLKMRKVPLSELPETEKSSPPPRHVSEKSEDGLVAEKRHFVKGMPDNCFPDMLQLVRKLCMEDRDVLEKGTQAFTSYIRAYKEHHCAFIFRFVSLDLGLLATSFCLLRLPKMPELREKIGRLPNFCPAGPEVDIHAIPFKDKVREEARQKRLAVVLAAGGKTAKQIKAERKQAEILQRQKERRQSDIAKGRNPNKKRGRQAQLFDEWDDLAKEERLYKKLRKRKITVEEYKKQLRGGSKSIKHDFESDDDSDHN